MAYNQKLVVAYAQAIGKEFGRQGSPRTAGVVMHVPPSKGTLKEYKQYALTMGRKKR